MRIRINAMLVLALLLMAIVLLPVLDQPGVTAEEGQVLWVIRDEVRDRGDTVAALRTNLESLLDRLPDLGQPPLYPLVLDVWTTAFGDSLLIVRALSLLCAMVTVAILVALTDYWWRLVMIALAPFLVAFIAFTATPLALFAPLSALAVLLQRRLWRKPSFWRMLLYALVLVMIFYTHGLALWFIAAYFFVAGLINRTNRQMANSMQLAILLYAPYLLSFRRSIPFGTSLEPIPIALLIYLIFLPFIIGYWRQQRVQMLRPVWMGVAVIMVGIGFWTVIDRPDWQNLIDTVRAERDLTHPIFLAYPPEHPLAYYDQVEETRLREGLTLDVGWRYFSPDEIDELLVGFDRISTVWLVGYDRNWTARTRMREVRSGEEVMDEAGDIIVYRFRRE